MMTPIYGNDPVLRQIRTMRARDRMPQAVLFWGERGRGRRSLARYFAMTALCTGENAPCGECPSCRKIAQDIHPDVMWPEHSGKRGGFSVETVRHVISDAIVAPNDGDRKVYIFTDCDGMDIRPQNTLLKLTEEPPAHVLLVFTALSRSAFLETMLSRMMPIAVRPCTPEECRRALTQAHGVRDADADAAVSACGGNIGQALAWLEDSDMQALTRCAAQITGALAQKDAYSVLRLLAGYEKDRQSALTLLELLDLQLRDALAMQYGQNAFAGCDRRSAEGLSRGLSVSRAARMHEAIRDAWEALDANVSTRIVLAALGGELVS